MLQMVLRLLLVLTLLSQLIPRSGAISPLPDAICPLDAVLAAMSIDLGSQFMKIGLVKPGVPMEIVLNKESHRKTPTLVYLRNGERLFGDAAMASVRPGLC
jgi:hypothetical protein